MKYVIDSCVAVKWILPELDTPKALRLRDDSIPGIHQIISPDILPVEALHALTLAQRQ